MVKTFALLIAIALGLFTVGTVPAMAGQCEDGTVSVSCDIPTAVQKGTKVPVWEVAYCVVGEAGGPYTKVDCESPQAVHMAPTGNEAVCFVGTDGKIHWDYQREVQIGRPFINRRVDGRWQPDWQTPPPY